MSHQLLPPSEFQQCPESFYGVQVAWVGANTRLQVHSFRLMCYALPCFSAHWDYPLSILHSHSSTSSPASRWKYWTLLPCLFQWVSCSVIALHLSLFLLSQSPTCHDYSGLGMKDPSLAMLFGEFTTCEMSIHQCTLEDGPPSWIFLIADRTLIEEQYTWLSLGISASRLGLEACIWSYYDGSSLRESYERTWVDCTYAWWLQLSILKTRDSFEARS